jgi:hypothetical protein
MMQRVSRAAAAARRATAAPVPASARLCARVCTRACAHVCVCVCARACACAQVCMRVRVCVRVHVRARACRPGRAEPQSSARLDRHDTGGAHMRVICAAAASGACSADQQCEAAVRAVHAAGATSPAHIGKNSTSESSENSAPIGRYRPPPSRLYLRARACSGACARAHSRLCRAARPARASALCRAADSARAAASESRRSQSSHCGSRRIHAGGRARHPLSPAQRSAAHAHAFARACVRVHALACACACVRLRVHACVLDRGRRGLSPPSYRIIRSITLPRSADESRIRISNAMPAARRPALGASRWV